MVTEYSRGRLHSINVLISKLPNSIKYSFIWIFKFEYSKLFLVPSLVLNIVFDDIHKLHSDPSGRHPENPWRLEYALSALRDSSAWSHITIHNTPEAKVDLLKLIHDEDYIRLIERESRLGFHYIDNDTYVAEHTFNVAARFTTAAYDSSIRSLENRELWLIMPRPGGHHAGRSGWAMGAPTLGFCIFNYAAMAAKSLLDRGLRVLIIDFDAHHGNGTQDIFWYEPRALHFDIHEEDIYPGTGYVDDIGGESAEGSKINVPLPAYSGDQQYMWVIERVLKPLIESFRPDAIVVSAGFDAHVGDPLTLLRATEKTYEAIGGLLRDLWVEGRIKALVSNLEGGYGEGLRRGFTSYIEALLGIRRYSGGIEPREPPDRILGELRKILSKYWGIGV